MPDVRVPTADEVAHVSGIVVHAPPERTAAVTAAIEALDGAEVAGGEGGKLVVVLEAPDEGALGDLFNHITLMEDVYSAALVSHYRDDPDLPGDEPCT